ncbi:hypothetical protein TNCV_2389871 [Trichonephila clavipes]|nr:hypothetical protein TNCV_2389871 [Trichonephila clavipes]
MYSFFALWIILLLHHGHGSPVVKATDSWLTYNRLEASADEHPPCRGCCYVLNLSRLKHPRWKLGKGVPARMSSRHLTMIQNYEVHHQYPSCSFGERR